jgi:hypothetical protein
MDNVSYYYYYDLSKYLGVDNLLYWLPRPFLPLTSSQKSSY